MKNYILVSLLIPPDNDRKQEQAYRALVGGSLHRGNLPEAEKFRLAENVWLLERENGVSVLAKIVSEAENYHIEAKVNFLSGD